MVITCYVYQTGFGGGTDNKVEPFLHKHVRPLDRRIGCNAACMGGTSQNLVPLIPKLATRNNLGIIYDLSQNLR